MTELLKSVDSWFLILAVLLLSGYFLWSVRGLFSDLKASIDELKATITKLFEDRNGHEIRITKIETHIGLCSGCNSTGHTHHRESDK